jgi:hypothetical protein
MANANGLFRRDLVFRHRGGLSDRNLHTFTRPENALPRGPYSGETGAPTSSPTSQPSSAEKIGGYLCRVFGVVGDQPGPVGMGIANVSGLSRRRGARSPPAVNAMCLAPAAPCVTRATVTCRGGERVVTISANLRGQIRRVPRSTWQSSSILPIAEHRADVALAECLGGDGRDTFANQISPDTLGYSGCSFRSCWRPVPAHRAPGPCLRNRSTRGPARFEGVRKQLEGPGRSSR